MLLAGLRSDQQGICKEPQWQSKRRVPFYPPQVPSSLQWGNSAFLLRQKDAVRPSSPPAVVHTTQTSSAEKVETPLAPRSSKPQRLSKTTLHQKEVHSAEQQKQHASNGINHALRKKAGLRSERQRNGRSEYQRHFQWKTPVSESPLLTAHQMLYASNRSIPPFKSNPLEMESEYKRNFKGSPPPRAPRLRRDVMLNEVPLLKTENISREKSKRKKRKEQQRSKEEAHPEPETRQDLQQEVSAPGEQVIRKAKTEYTSSFRSPLQYRYKDGTWVRSRIFGEEGGEWYHEVRELREKAEVYRKRAWGTHFSRQHLSQILSEQNCLWEASSASLSSTLTERDSHSLSSPVIEALDLARVDSVRGSTSPRESVPLSTSRRSSLDQVGLSKVPTLPVQRKLAWEEEASPCERGVTQIKHQEQNESDEEEDTNEHSEDKREKVIVPVSEPSSPSAGSRSSTDEGRLPTPKLKNMLSAQRTHHDRTTPTTGGAVLVSPPKTKNTSRAARKSEAPLGKAHSSYRHLSQDSPVQAFSKAENGSLPRSSPAAGMATVDPLPLREDTWDSPETSPEQKPARASHKRASSARFTGNSSPHANRIQGTLRNPEFQHNGNLGPHWGEQFAFPSSDSGVSDNEDRMSQISSRSAASCCMASQVLDRAQRRKEDFWGKS